MARTLAPLVYYNRVDGTYINVGTGSWQHWLNNNSNFRYESFWGSFTACQEQQGEEIVWLAYRRLEEQLRRAYLGTNKDLTLETLVDTAKRLSASNTSCWEPKTEVTKSDATSTTKLNTELKTISQEPGISPVRQWCIFYSRPSGQVEFIGAFWEKEQALTQIQTLVKLARDSRLSGNAADALPGTYEIKEELVLPASYIQQGRETTSFAVEPTTKELELLHQVSQLRHRLSELQRQLDQERRLHDNCDESVKFIWN
jgi:IS1 family transposase